MKMEPVTIQLGDTAVTIFTIGVLKADLAAWYWLTPEDVDDEIRPFLERPLAIPIQSVLIQQVDTNILVDAPRFDIAKNSPYYLPGIVPPPGLIDQLAQAGVSADDVTHVIITHPHFDHFNGLTIKKHKEILPLFPLARHYLSQADWDLRSMQRALTKPRSLESKTLGILQQQGLLELVNAPFDLSERIRILAAPGETPGHQIVRVEAGGRVLYCLGDLFHHELELLLPGTAVYWADAKSMINSQRRLIEAALAENALLIAAHIPGYGRIVQTGDGLVWQRVRSGVDFKF
jgi:glyoxylase-like metal-dependent hydrolase (beta-lactamase superfamily II)